MKTVTQGKWGVSTTTTAGVRGRAVLSVYVMHDLPNKFGGRGRLQKGDHDGRVFTAATSSEASDAAFAFALERGYLRRYYQSASLELHAQRDRARVRHARRRARKQCTHRRIILIGNEETGLRAIRCEKCGGQLERRRAGDVYVYYEAEEYE